jgi:hypothetical protein
MSLVGRDDRARSVRRLVTWPRLAVAAAVIGVLILGLPALGGLMTQMDGGGTATNGAAENAEDRDSGQKAAPAAPPSGLDGAAVSFSGMDYTATSLKTLRRTLMATVPDLTYDSTKTVPAPTSPSMPSYAVESEAPLAARGAGPVPTELARLLDPIALRACVTAVESGTPGRVATVDFARYEGRPALIVTVTTAPSTTRNEASGVTAVVVGPACGVAGPDRIAGTDQD